jgi:hypothetical protein
MGSMMFTSMLGWWPFGTRLANETVTASARAASGASSRATGSSSLARGAWTAARM